jgi:GT2 family glycosyltransferase
MTTYEKFIEYPKVSIIILNWNGKEDTIECLESLKKITYPNYEIIVVDNGSTDGSTEFLERTYPDINIIKNEKNLGYAEGNNVGIRDAIKRGTNYLLILNNDTAVDPSFLDKLIGVIESNPKIGVIGPKICYYSEPWLIQSNGEKINFWTGNTRSTGWRLRDSSIDRNLNFVDFVYGACLLVKADLAERVGLFDSRFFIYSEEMDFCMKIRQTGYKIVCIPDAKIFHKDQVSSSKVSYLAKYYQTRNRIIFMKRWAKYYQYPVFLLLFIIYQIVLTIKYQTDMKYIRCFLKGYVDGLFSKF